MKRLSLWLLFFAVLGIQSVLAQTYTVKGNVVSKTDNEPLIGVSILQKGTTNGVVTDEHFFPVEHIFSEIFAWAL